MTSHIRQTINAVMADILSQGVRAGHQIQETDSIAKDLGFTSLDVAQLIATLEMELGVDPFSQGAPISEVNTVAKLYAVYEEHLATAA